MATRLLGSDTNGVAIPVPLHVAKMLSKLCDSMIDGGGFLLLVKSLQKEFRNTASGRVMPSDQLKLLHVLWFCTRYRRVVAQKLKKTLPPAIPGILNKWLFVFVVKCCQIYDPSAKTLSSSWGALGLSVALLTEILASLNAMVTSNKASNQTEGIKLQRIIFYDADLIYTLQSLLSTWDERKVGIPHLSHLVHSTHLIFKCATRFAQGGEDAVMLSKRVRRRKKLKKKKEEKKEEKKRRMKMLIWRRRRMMMSRRRRMMMILRRKRTMMILRRRRTMMIRRRRRTIRRRQRRKRRRRRRRSGRENRH